MKTLAALAALGILISAGAPAPAAQSSQKKTATKKPAKHVVASRPLSKPPVKGPNRSRPSKSKPRAAAKPKTVRRAGQQAPSPDRYREIQQALADKGYLKGDATGRWDEESVQALRRFEQDQNLKPDGKLDSLALIALGLGPKRSPETVAPDQ